MPKTSDDLITLVKQQIPGSYSEHFWIGMKHFFQVHLGEIDSNEFNNSPYEKGYAEHEAFLYGNLIGRHALDYLKMTGVKI